MNKIVLWVIAAVVVIGGAAYFIMNGSSMSEGSQTSTATTTSSGQQSSGTLKDLLARGGSEQCQITVPSNGTSGTVFVASGEMRADFSLQTKSGTVTSHMISDGKTTYMWSSAMAEGIKMAVSATPQASSTASTQDPYNEQVNYNCTPWGGDSTEFTLPANITFQDMSALTPSGASTGASVGASSGASAECGECDQAPSAAAKAACREALHCQ